LTCFEIKKILPFEKNSSGNRGPPTFLKIFYASRGGAFFSDQFIFVQFYLSDRYEKIINNIFLEQVLFIFIFYLFLVITGGEK